MPGIFVEAEPGAWHYLSPEECGRGYRLDGRKTICNPGSVGQPRDGDWRACYALFDGEVVRFRRVEYDVEATISKIQAIPALDDILGDWLREGRWLRPRS
jgi:diadenosine tetraphosphatase ApaH/serine/threonine PP2A family protein phosphatase